jgi:hypothetical protein
MVPHQLISIINLLDREDFGYIQNFNYVEFIEIHV